MTIGRMKVSSCHPLPLKLPKVHTNILYNSLSFIKTKSEVRAEKKAAAAVPVKIITVVLLYLP